MSSRAGPEEQETEDMEWAEQRKGGRRIRTPQVHDENCGHCHASKLASTTCDLCDLKIGVTTIGRDILLTGVLPRRDS